MPAGRGKREMAIIPTPGLRRALVAAALGLVLSLGARAQEDEGAAEPVPFDADAAGAGEDEATGEAEEKPKDLVVKEAEEAPEPVVVEDLGGELPTVKEGLAEPEEDEGDIGVLEPPPPGGRIPEEFLRPEHEEHLVSRATKGLPPTHARRVRTYYHQSLRAYRARRYRLAVRYCEEALRSDPENLAVQRMLYTAKIARQKHELRLEAEYAHFLDEDALADVDRETTFPEKQPPLPRPELPLRENAPKSLRLRRMQELLNQRVSMNFIEADLDYVLQTLFKISGVDIMAEQSIIEDKVLTLHVENVPLREILEFIKRNYEGIDYTVTENSIWLVTPEKPPLVPRVYPLSRGLVSSAGFQTGVRSSSRGGGRSSGPRSISGTRPGGIARAGGVGGRAGSGGDSHLEAVLSWVETWEDEWPANSSWHLDLQTTSLMVLTTPEMHERVEEMLDIMDTVPVQVLVRTKFIEVRAEDMKEMGLGLLFLEQDIEIPKFPVTMDSGQLTFRKTYDLASNTRLVAELKLLMEDKRTKVLSAPQIIAMNNTPAQIDISKSFSYASEFGSTSSSRYLPGGTVSDYASAFIPTNYVDVDVGFFLEFVPSVGRDMKNIVLDLHARVDDVLGTIEDFTETPIVMPTLPDEEDPTGGLLPQLATSGQNSFKRPVIDSREFTTRLVVEDGGTVVIGGLLKNNREVLNRKVPILGDIPLIGLLFRARKEVLIQSNLIIVVQADIVTPSGRNYQTPSQDTDIPSGGAGDEPAWFTELEPELESRAPGDGLQ
jgi:type II secretory pathway component GspD/PulD (secretin)